MPAFIASKIFLQIPITFSKNKVIEICFLGLTFKENCSDTSNYKIFDVITILKNSKKANFIIKLVDSFASPEAVLK